MLPNVIKVSIPKGALVNVSGKKCIDKTTTCFHYLENAQELVKEDLLQLVDKTGGERDIIIKAYEKAYELHSAVLRESLDSLYIIHPLSAAYSLASLHASSDIIAAALLHDTVEDCPYTAEELAQDFNSPIPEIVDAVTKVSSKDTVFFNGFSDDIRKRGLDELTKDKLYDAKYWYEALLVKLADREHNLSTISAVTPNHARSIAQKTLLTLIPPAKELGIRYYYNTLNNYCFKKLYQ